MRKELEETLKTFFDKKNKKRLRLLNIAPKSNDHEEFTTEYFLTVTNKLEYYIEETVVDFREFNNRYTVKSKEIELNPERYLKNNYEYLINEFKI